MATVRFESTDSLPILHHPKEGRLFNRQVVYHLFGIPLGHQFLTLEQSSMRSDDSMKNTI